MQINWVKCSEQMPPKTNDYKLIYRIMGECTKSDGSVLNAISEIHPEWELKKLYVEWIPYTEEAWKHLNSNSAEIDRIKTGSEILSK